MYEGLGFREVVVVDFEFCAPPGESPRPICLVAHELHSGRKIRLFGDELIRTSDPPYSTGRDTLFVAYYASAELGCHLALNWAIPVRVLDLYVEFRNRTNGIETPCGNGLLGAMAYYGLDVMAVAEKEAMRALAMRGGPYSDGEQRALLDYCESDVAGLSRLLARMLPDIDLPRALLRGRFMVAAARVERCGIPVDAESLGTLRQNWTAIKLRLIDRIDHSGVFECTAFRAEKWMRVLANAGIPWPCLPSGRMDLSDEVFRLMAERFPAIVEPYRQLRILLSQMRLEELTIGADQRNRYLLSAFSSRTGRNQPSNTKSIFGPAVWLRSLIRPTPGYGIAYVDWSQQEFGIAAALSQDAAMMAAYESGDPYLAFAKQASAVPQDATTETHGHVRNIFKECVLGVQYAMGPDTLAQRIGQAPAEARELLRMHRSAFPKFWEWSDSAVDRAMLLGSLSTVFGWTIYAGPDANPRSLRNYPMQANGAELLRLACCLATEGGIRVCAPVHDALLIEAPAEELDEAVRCTQTMMAEASRTVLDGFVLRSDAKTFLHPDRFMDERGQAMWSSVLSVLAELDSDSSAVLSSSVYVPPETPDTPDTSTQRGTLHPSVPTPSPHATEGDGASEGGDTQRDAPTVPESTLYPLRRIAS